jgi:hypothetical protein
MASRNIRLYIKRCEANCANKEYICEAFKSNNYGIVNDIKLIEKNNANGEKYYGVIVVFGEWFMNERVRTLFHDLETNDFNTAKLYHDRITLKYWIVNEFKHKLEEDAIEDKRPLISEDLVDEKEKIRLLETLARSLLVQMEHLQVRCDKYEQTIMTCEENQRHDYVKNMGMRFEVEDKIQELEEKNKQLEEKNKQIDELNEKIQELTTIMAFSEITL